MRLGVASMPMGATLTASQPRCPHRDLTISSLDVRADARSGRLAVARTLRMNGKTAPTASPSTLYRTRFGTAEFDQGRFELRVGGLLVELQHKPLRLLAMLLAAPGQVLAKEHLLDTIWEERATGDAVLANAASKLRAALGQENAGFIVTVQRQGYRFEGSLERMAVGRTAAVASPLALRAGMAVPGRAGHQLKQALGRSQRNETWLAEQPRTGDRRVFKFALDGERLADLKREVTIARVLRETLGQRSDFARVLDWSFVAPPFWLEYEYAGENLDQWAATPQGATTRLAALPPDERLGLGLQIADALAAAHGAAVLHRDLKPANILLAPQPVPAGAGGPLGWQLRLTDFGSGRLLDPGVLERLRVTQLGMTVDFSDATSSTPLYIAPELIAGGTPTTASDIFALGVILFQLLAGDLRRTLAPGWERDIDDALLREDIAAATDIDPQRRLGSAAELAMRLRQLPQRRDERETRLQAQAAALAQQQELARLQAVARQAESVQALNRLLREDLIGAANPRLQGQADVTVAEALRGAAERVDIKYGALPAAVRGGLHLAMQSALGELSRAQEAVAAGERAVAAFEQAQTEGPATEVAADLFSARARLALDLVQLSRLDEAARLVVPLEASLAAAASHTQGTVPTLEHQVDRSRVLYVKAWVTGGRLALQESTDYLEQAFALVERLDDDQAPCRGPIVFGLADNLTLLGQLDRAGALYRRLHAEQTQRYGSGHVRTLYTLLGLGVVLTQQGRCEEARQALETSAVGLAAGLGPAHRQSLTALDMLADLRFRQGDAAGAAADWERVQTGYAALMGPGSSYTLTPQTQRAQALQRCGQTQTAVELLRDALGRARAFLAEDAPQLQQIRYTLADCLLDLGHAAEAASLAHGLRAETLIDAEREPDWPARLLRLQERLQEGLQ